MTNQTFPAKTEALPDVLGFVEETLEEYGCPMKIQMALCVAIEEVFVNVAHYAYGGGDGQVTLGIGFDAVNSTITFRMADMGIPFDPLKKPDPDITLSAEEREIGGLGIFITKKTMDSISYSYENGENVLTMTKKM
jgi:anti-sigma regulatory factor (Ser/Thr protein kinase)